MLEWGLGNSSTRYLIDARETLGLGSLYSFENVQGYFDTVLANLPQWVEFHPFCIDLTGPTTNDRDQGYNYATFPLSLGRKFDIIFIDGRRRMECALTAAQLCHNDTIVFLHDYRRQRYQSIRMLFDIVEDGTQFRVMRLKPQLRSLANVGDRS
jgi:hypothetical protein